MVNVHKAAFISFMLPCITSLMPAFMPDTDMLYFYIALAIMLLTILAYPILLLFFGRKRHENAARVVLLINSITFCLFFIFPLIKIYSNYLWMQLLLLGFFIFCLLFSIYDQRREKPLLFPERGEENKFSLIFYFFPVVLTLIGGGGNIFIVREMVLTIGYKPVSIYFSIAFYLIGCWLVCLFMSLNYQGLVKEGLWVKRKKTSPKNKIPYRA